MAKLEMTASKWPRAGRGLIEIVRDYGDIAFGGEEFAQGFEHGWREIERDVAGCGAGCFDEREEPAAAAADIQNATNIGGDKLEQRGFAFDAVGD